MKTTQNKEETPLQTRHNVYVRTRHFSARPPLEWLAMLILLTNVTQAATFKVTLGPGGPVYVPSTVVIQPGDTVEWTWVGTPPFHLYGSVTSGTPDLPTDLFDSGIHSVPYTFSYTFPNAGSYYYFNQVNHIMTGLVSVTAPSPTPTPTPASQSQLLNISTRVHVQTGENVLIGGFIVTGNAPKKVILRAIGPSLTQAGVAGALADPVLELHASDGSLITTNDSWKDTQEAEIMASGIPPADELESAIVATLDPGSYTAILSGKNGTSGVGLVEGYDLDQPADSQLANISTRGFVETENNVMIGGFILGNGSGTANILIRALGASLADVGITDALADPALELHDANGDLIMSNDNWRSDQEAEIMATTIPPSNDLEAAIVTTVAADAYTAIVAGKDGLTGVSLLEVYHLP
jgi:plastocyanin